MTEVDLLQPEGIHYEGGHWIGWTKDQGTMLSIGPTARAVRQAARRRGVPDADIVYEWVTPANERFLVPSSIRHS